MSKQTSILFDIYQFEMVEIHLSDLKLLLIYFFSFLLLHFRQHSWLTKSDLRSFKSCFVFCVAHSL